MQRTAKTSTTTRHARLGARLARTWDLWGVLALIGASAGSGAYTLLGL